MLGFLQLAPSNGGSLPRDRLIHKDVPLEGVRFHNRTDYSGVVISIELLKWGTHIFGILGSGVGERILVRRDLRMGRHSLKGDKK